MNKYITKISDKRKETMPGWRLPSNFTFQNPFANIYDDYNVINNNPKPEINNIPIVQEERICLTCNKKTKDRYAICSVCNSAYHCKCLADDNFFPPFQWKCIKCAYNGSIFGNRGVNTLLQSIKLNLNNNSYSFNFNYKRSIGYELYFVLYSAYTGNVDTIDSANVIVNNFKSVLVCSGYLNILNYVDNGENTIILKNVILKPQKRDPGIYCAVICTINMSSNNLMYYDLQECFDYYSNYYTKLLINIVTSNDNEDIEVADSLELSLMDNTSLLRIKIPGRGITCDHVQCFDIYTYLELNLKSGKWKCPICYKKCELQSIRIDSYIYDILKSCNEEKVIIDKNYKYNIIKEDILVYYFIY